MPSYDLILHRNRDGAGADIEDAPEPLSVEDDPDVLDNIEIERHYRSSQEDWAADAYESDEFVHNVMFTEEQVNALAERAQSATPINVVWPAVEQAIAMLTTNNPRFQATGREDSDTKTARVIADLLSWIWEQSGGNACLKAAIFDYYVKGRGVLQAYVDRDGDFGKGEIRIVDVDPLDVFPDPNSKDRLWRDAAHVLISRSMSREQIEGLWPDAASLMPAVGTDIDYGQTTNRVALQGQHLKGDVVDGYHEMYRVIERYTKVKVKYVNVQEMFSQEEFIFLPEEYEKYLEQPAAIVVQGEESNIATEEEYQAALEAWEEEGQPTEDERTRIVYPPPEQDPQTGQPIEIPPIQISLVTMNDLLQMGQIEVFETLQNRIKLVITVGNKLYFKGYLPLEHYPLVPLNNRHNRNPYPMSDVQFVRPIQEQINKLQALMTANAATSTNVKAFVPKGSVDKDQVEADFAKAGAAIIEYDAEFGAPVIAQPIPMSNGLFNHFQTLIHLVEQEMGIYALMQGDASQAPNTHKGTIAIEQFGQRRIRSKLDDIEHALNQMGRVMVTLIQNVYTERKVVRLVQPNNIVRESVANQLQYDEFGAVIGRAMDVTSGYYDVIVVSGSTLPSNRFALLDTYVELYQANLIDQVEVLKKTDVADAEGVLERMGAISQMQRQIEEMGGKIEELEGDIQTREREVFHTKVALAVEKEKSKMGKTATRAEMAETLFEQRAKDEIALMRRENMANQKMANTNGRTK